MNNYAVRYFSRSLHFCGVDIKSLNRTQLFDEATPTSSGKLDVAVVVAG